MPDLQKPSLLKAHGVSHVLEEACAFIDCAMARGNTIVHCERGQFRSPTLILAWLITRVLPLLFSLLLLHYLSHAGNDNSGSN
jgi:protein-tyrosine phosphatase